MAFDAGTIDARLTIDPDAFDRSLAKAKADVEKFERDGHKVKISAVFDTGSVGRARKMFADLDNSISRDAMNRLKSSPQGSVLGSLNALFSPHPVTGAPSPSQSAEGGLLGKMLNPQTSGGGGGYSNGGGSPLGSALAQTADITDNVRQNLTGAQPGNITTTDDIKQALTGTGASNTTTTDDIRQALVGQGATNTTTTDDIKQALVGQGAKNTTTTDKIMQQMVGSGPGNTSTTDTIREKLDPKSTGDVEKAAEDSGGRSGGRWTAGFGAHLGPFFAGFHKRLGDAGEDGGKQLGGGLLSGMGPGILGIGMKMSLMVGAIGSALAVLPALAGLIGVGMGVAMIGGLLAEAVKGNAKLKAQFTALGGDFTSTISKAVAPIVPVISKALASLGPMIKSLQGPLTSIFKEIGPQIAGIFKGVGPVITGLLSVMKAAAPAFGPFIEAIEKLVGNLLPGIATVIKATVPFISQFAGILGSLGSSLGALFATAAPAIGASMKILGGLLGLVGDLLPVIMQLADIFAKSLAPVFTAFAGVVQTLLKPLVTIGGVIARFAGAVIGDLAGAFGAVATLITAIGPSLGVLAKAFGSLFTVLENAGVFALIGDALENLAPALGKLIALLITDLAPILPMIVGLFSQLLTITVDLATSGLGFLIRVLTDLVTALPAGLVQALVGGFIALKLVMMGFEGVEMIFAGVSAAVTALGAALDFDTIALKAMYAWDVLVTVATKAWEMAQIVLDAVLNLSPLGLIVIAIAAIGAAIYELVDHWTTVWGTIQSVAEDAWNFIFNGIGKYLLVLLGPGGAIVLGLIELYQHWNTIWGDVKTVAQGIWNWLSGVFGTDLVNFFTATIPGWLTTLKNDAVKFGTDLLVPFKAVWTWLSGTFGPDISKFFTVTIPGWLGRLITLVGSVFVTPFQNAIKGAWTWVTTNVFDKMDTFFTTTLPGWFSTAVGAIGRFWDGLETTVSKPVTWVLKNVVDPLFGAIDDVTNFVGLGKPLPANLASGGKLPGYGGGDVVPALLEPGETVVDKDKSRQFGWLFKLMGVPGYAAGGVVGGAVDVAKVIADLATGNLGAAGRALLSVTGAGGALGQFAATLTDVPATMVSDAVKYLVKDAKAALIPKGYKLSGSAASVMALMKSMAAGRGWTGTEWTALNAVEMAEAGYNLNAQNPTSGAYGIAQFINGASEYAQWGGNANTAAGQITGMLNYIASRYVDPEAAWAHESSYHWYGAGGPINEPVVGYGVSSGRGYVFGENGPEYVTPGGSPPGGGSDPALLARMDALIAATRGIPAGVGDQVGGAIGGAASAASFRSRYPRGGS